jgi:hypothetical protein
LELFFLPLSAILPMVLNATNLEKAALMTATEPLLDNRTANSSISLVLVKDDSR